jgi:large subunit ribosomal protein L29
MKLQEIKEKTVDELKDMILDSKKELFTLRMGHNKLKQLENTASIRNTKKDIARMKTVLRQKELNSVKG